MTSTLDRSPARPGRSRWRVRSTPLVWVIALTAVAVRLPLLARPPSPDEAGFLLVGSQWHSGGTSLYGDYWVDRPPLLITIFQAADAAGGLVALRLIGCLAALLTVLGAAHLARQLAGPRAAVWSALTAAALLVSPLTGSMAVNGELLAAPFVVWGIVAVVHALRVRRHHALLAVAAGSALVCSVLVKQNFADIGVFVVVATAIALFRRELTGAQARTLLAWFAVGAGTTLGVVSVWTLLHGTSLAGAYDAMFPFRVEAGRLLASSANQASRTRLSALLLSWLVCGGAVLMLLTLAALTRRRLTGTVVWALTVTVVFEACSVLLGGSYWSHYLIQLVAPLSVLAGVAAARTFTGMRPLIAGVVVLAGVAWAVALPWQGSSLADSVGTSISRVAGPDDTIVTVYGHAELTRASGLASPYPYLWSLPAKTRDPDLHQLTEVLSGPQAPTWFVTWSHLGNWGVDSASASRVLAARYHPVARPKGHTIYLRNGVRRRAPTLEAPVPRNPPTFTTVIKELMP